MSYLVALSNALECDYIIHDTWVQLQNSTIFLQKYFSETIGETDKINQCFVGIYHYMFADTYSLEFWVEVSTKHSKLPLPISHASVSYDITEFAGDSMFYILLKFHLVITKTHCYCSLFMYAIIKSNY
jgi:hypothetical protein